MLSRRSFLAHSALAGVASVVPFGLSGCGASGGTGASRALKLVPRMDGEEVARQLVLEWEARRLQIIADRMSRSLPAAVVGELAAAILRPAASTANLAEERERLADAKLLAGDAAMRELFAQDVALTTAATELAVAAPAGWVRSELDILSNRGTAEGFADWYITHNRLDDQRANLVACPDHIISHPTPPKNGQDVIEITGGATLASHFVIDYDDAGDLPIIVDPDFPVRFSGAAVNDNGTTIGGINHRFRTLAEGFHAHLCILFPASLPPTMVSEHRWHLACEFSNWIAAYVEETGD